MLNVEFISLLIVIIYIGAVAILFLFVTFMLGGDPADKSTQKKMKIKQSIIFLAIMKISFLVDFLDVLSDHINIVKKVDITNLYHLYLYSTGDIYIFNTLLYGRFGSLIVLIAFILFLVLLAAISLVKNKAK